MSPICSSFPTGREGSYSGAGAPACLRHFASLLNRLGFPRLLAGLALTVEMSDAGRPSPRMWIDRSLGFHQNLIVISTDLPPRLLFFTDGSLPTF
jgi:hypothetical protein